MTAVQLAGGSDSRSESMDIQAFERLESNVRTYCRTFPAVFERAKGALVYDESGRSYIDFFAGAGALNYGHNPDFIKPHLIRFLESDKLLHSLDMYTSTKRTFLETFERTIFAPRGLDYKVQCCGPTGASAVEAALKLARQVTARSHVAAFHGGWHGMSQGCLAVTGNRFHRAAAGIPLSHTTFLPYADGPYRIPDSLKYIDGLLEDANSGVELPAAIIVECVQAESGVYVAPAEWLRGLRALCDRHRILMIVDDVQVGCGRTGQFFSFEAAGIVPDIVCLSKAIGGYGLPMALVLMRRDLDQWQPGQHTGTFRGNQLAFLAATVALEQWTQLNFKERVNRNAQLLADALRAVVAPHPRVALRGSGLIWGVDFSLAGGPDVARAVAERAFHDGLIIERCGRNDVVLKVLPPLTIEEDLLQRGCQIIGGAIQECLID